MRTRRLLFVLAYFLSGAATPGYAALGEAPRCFPTTQGTLEIAAVNLPIPELSKAAPDYDAEERDYLIRTIAFEASGEPEEGKSAVAHAILNRILSGRWGDSIKDVVTRPWLRAVDDTAAGDAELSPSDPRYESAARIADAVLAGEMPDPTAGATHFLNPIIVQRRRAYRCRHGRTATRTRSAGILSIRPNRVSPCRTCRSNFLEAGYLRTVSRSLAHAGRTKRRSALPLSGQRTRQLDNDR